MHAGTVPTEGALRPHLTLLSIGPLGLGPHIRHTAELRGQLRGRGLEGKQRPSTEGEQALSPERQELLASVAGGSPLGTGPSLSTRGIHPEDRARRRASAQLGPKGEQTLSLRSAIRGAGP